MKVLVTGATGYLGAVAATALAAREHEVVGLARSQRSANALRGHGIDLAAIRKATGLTQVELAAKRRRTGSGVKNQAPERDAWGGFEVSGGGLLTKLGVT